MSNQSAKPNFKIYICGPMSGYADFNLHKFNEVANKLRNDGYQVVNMAEIFNAVGIDLEAETIDSALAPDIAEKLMELEPSLIKSCTTIFLLDGWQKSVGAKRELAIACKENKEIVLEKDWIF